MSYTITLTDKDLVEIEFKDKQSQFEEFSQCAVYYEDQKYSNKVLTKENIKKLNLSVVQYLGYNFSSNQLSEFNKLCSMHIYKDIQNITRKLSNEYYVISYIHGDEETRKHELAHYEYWKTYSVRQNISKLVSKNKCDYVVKELMKLGYSEQVIETEIYAFGKVEDLNMNIKLRRELKKIYNSLTV